MLTIEEAMAALEEYAPGRTITEAFLYKDSYLLTAPRSTKDIDYGDPYYLVNKKTGQVRNFLPMSDLPGFFNAMTNHPVKLKR